MRVDLVAIDLVRIERKPYKYKGPPGRDITISNVSKGGIYCATIYCVMQKEKVDQCNHCLQQYQLQGRQY